MKYKAGDKVLIVKECTYSWVKLRPIVGKIYTIRTVHINPTYLRFTDDTWCYEQYVATPYVTQTPLYKAIYGES